MSLDERTVTEDFVACVSFQTDDWYEKGLPVSDEVTK